MVAAVFVLVIAAGALAAGIGHVRKARSMRGYRSTVGQVVARDVAAIPGVDLREGRWGRGGGYEPRIVYRYSVDGVEFTGDRLGYVRRGLKRAIAERRAAAYPDELQVWFDPADPREAYLERHTPGLGWALVALGVVLAAGALAAIAAA